jgi:hypothetical protein
MLHNRGALSRPGWPASQWPVPRMALRNGGYSLTTPTVAIPRREHFILASVAIQIKKDRPPKRPEDVGTRQVPPTGTAPLDFGANGRQGMKEAAQLRQPLLDIPAPPLASWDNSAFFGLGLRKRKGDRQQRRSPLLRAYRRGRQLPTSTFWILGRVPPQCILQIVNFRKGPSFVLKRDRSEP